MSRDRALAAALAAFAAGYFLAAQPAQADLGVKCAHAGITAKSTEKAMAEVMAGGRERLFSTGAGNLVCAW